MNEWRQEENKQAVEGGDIVLVSANLKSLEELTKQPGLAEPTSDADTKQSGTTDESDENKDNDNGEE